MKILQALFVLFIGFLLAAYSPPAKAAEKAPQGAKTTFTVVIMGDGAGIEQAKIIDQLARADISAEITVITGTFDELNRSDDFNTDRFKALLTQGLSELKPDHSAKLTDNRRFDFQTITYNRNPDATAFKGFGIETSARAKI